MKKVSLILAALALVLGISQCKKQEEPAASGQKQHIVLTADNGNDGSKVSADFVSANLNLTWEGNEVITVSGGAKGTLDKITVDESNPSNATFEGDIEIIDESKPFEFTVGDTPNYEGQPGTEDGCEGWIKNNISLTGTDDYDPQGQYSADMKLPYAVLKLDVSALGSSGELEIKVGETLVASVTDVSTLAAVFVAVPTDGNYKVYKISIGDKTAVKEWTLLPNTFYTKSNGTGGGTGDAIVIEPVGGKIINFSINDDYETNDNLEFNFTIEPNAGCVFNSDACLCLSLYNSSPEIDNCDQIIVCQYPYNTGSISKDEIKSLDYESGEPIYIRLWVEFKDSDGFCGEPVYVYSDVIEASFTFGEEE